MYEIRVETEFAAAHHLRGHGGACKNLHGHNWGVEVFFAAGCLDKLGMVIDFADVDSALSNILQQLDHSDINSHDYFKKINPTAENIAKWIYDQLLEKLGKTASAVTLHETSRSSATYRP